MEKYLTEYLEGYYMCNPYDELNVSLYRNVWDDDLNLRVSTGTHYKINQVNSHTIRKLSKIKSKELLIKFATNNLIPKSNLVRLIYEGETNV